MKTSILLIAILILSSCIFPEPEGRYYPIEYKFEAINNSGVDIKIIGFDGSFRTETLIPNSRTVFKSFQSSSMDKNRTFSDVFGGDSIKVIFGMKKADIFYCYLGRGGGGCSKPRNILVQKNILVTDINSKKNGKIFLDRFTFEPIDYENAEDCNGNCE